MSQQLFLSQPYLKFRVDAGLAMSVIYSLIMNIKNKDVLPYDHRETFDFMVDHLIESFDAIFISVFFDYFGGRIADLFLHGTQYLAKKSFFRFKKKIKRPF